LPENHSQQNLINHEIVNIKSVKSQNRLIFRSSNNRQKENHISSEIPGASCFNGITSNGSLVRASEKLGVAKKLWWENFSLSHQSRKFYNIIASPKVRQKARFQHFTKRICVLCGTVFLKCSSLRPRSPFEILFKLLLSFGFFSEIGRKLNKFCLFVRNNRQVTELSDGIFD
jgi:hypothetical protein